MSDMDATLLKYYLLIEIVIGQLRSIMNDAMTKIYPLDEHRWKQKHQRTMVKFTLKKAGKARCPFKKVSYSVVSTFKVLAWKIVVKGCSLFQNILDYCHEI